MQLAGLGCGGPPLQGPLFLGKGQDSLKPPKEKQFQNSQCVLSSPVR